MRTVRLVPVAFCLAAACGGDDAPAYEPGEELSGGERGTVFDTTREAMSRPIPGLNDDGQTFVVAAGRKFNLLHINEMGARTLASPALVDGTWYWRTDEALVAIR